MLVLLLIAVMGCAYISQKEGYHMDELLSFELSNAEFTPWIVPTQPEGRLEKFVRNEIEGDSFGDTVSNLIAVARDVVQNKGNSRLLSYQADVYEQPVWMSADTFHKYLTTDSTDRFNLLSVYYNVKDDNHPPLHFMLLHLVSSVFEGQIHPWMGCCINLVCVLLICILLMKICTEFLHRPYLGIAASILYGASLAGIQTLLLIRMYALLTFWCVLVLYLHLKKIVEGNWKNGNKKLIAAIVCGFVTQYFFILYMLVLAIVTFLHLLFKTDKKQALYYLRTLVISGIWGLLLFPFAISDVLSSGRGVEAVHNLGSGFSGLGERLYSFFHIVCQEVIGTRIQLVVFGLILMAGVITAFIRRKKLYLLRESGKRIILLALILPAAGYFLIVSKAAPYYADRYIMPVFPLIALLIVMLLEWMTEQIGGARVQKDQAKLASVIVAVLALCLVLPGIFTVTPTYLYKGYQKQIAVSAQYADADCLCVYDGVGYYQNLVEFTNYKDTLLVTQKELLGRPADQRLSQDQKLVVLLKNGISEKKVSAYLQQHYGFRMTRVLLQNGVHQDTIYYYEK